LKARVLPNLVTNLKVKNFLFPKFYNY